jgi:hypothetical protein
MRGTGLPVRAAQRRRSSAEDSASSAAISLLEVAHA